MVEGKHNKVSPGLIPGIKIWQNIWAGDMRAARALLEKDRDSLGEEAKVIESTIDAMDARNRESPPDVIVPAPPIQGPRAEPKRRLRTIIIGPFKSLRKTDLEPSRRDRALADEVITHLKARTNQDSHRAAALKAFSSIQNSLFRGEVLIRVINCEIKDLQGGGIRPMGKRYALNMQFSTAHYRLKEEERKRYQRGA